MKKLSDTLEIRGRKLRNRVAVPPMYIGPYSGPNGTATEKTVKHYASMAEGGAGLIIQEATAVTADGLLAFDQLGIWSDEHIPDLKKVTEAVHAAGGTILVQIHHAGLVGVCDRVISPGAYTHTDRYGKTKDAHVLTEDEIEEVVEAFVLAAKRAVLAGYDGVELHGCHGYLISQFLNKTVNRRCDRWGEEEAFVLEIYNRVRAAVPEDFIVGVRLAAFEPTLEDGMRHAKVLDAAGVDFLDISYGFGLRPVDVAPKGWKFSHAVWGAAEIKKEVSVPVFAVDNICTPEDAAAVLAETGVDMVDIGRSVLTDYAWAKHALNGEPTGACVHCTHCQWYSDPERCAGKLLLAKRTQK